MNAVPAILTCFTSSYKTYLCNRLTEQVVTFLSCIWENPAGTQTVLTAIFRDFDLPVGEFEDSASD